MIFTYLSRDVLSIGENSAEQGSIVVSSGFLMEHAQGLMPICVDMRQ
jgi:hypothetical protein